MNVTRTVPGVRFGISLSRLTRAAISCAVAFFADRLFTSKSTRARRMVAPLGADRTPRAGQVTPYQWREMSAGSGHGRQLRWTPTARLAVPPHGTCLIAQQRVGKLNHERQDIRK